MVQKKAYLLTGCIVPLLENRHKLKLTSDVADKIRAIELAYFQEIQRLLEGHCFKGESGEFLYDPQFVSDLQIQDALKQLISKNRSGLPLINFDDVYCHDVHDGVYSVTRLVDPNNLDAPTRLGPRPGFPPLEEQVRDIAKNHGRQVDVMDIGAFAGETLIGEINRFRD